MARSSAAALMALVCAAPAQAAGGWSTPVPIPGASGVGRDRTLDLLFDSGQNGLALWKPGFGSFAVNRTTDGAASWGPRQDTPRVSEDLHVALDGAGNRVYVFRAGSFLRVVRTTPAGGPDATTFKDLQLGDPGTVSLAVNTAGDALIGYTSDNTSSTAGAVFWAHDAAEPNAPQTFTGAQGTTLTTPFVVLDPGRSAVFTFQSAAQMVQVTAADASAAQPFGAQVPLTDGSSTVAGMRGAQNPAGQAAIEWYEQSPADRFDLHAATRAAGQPFHPPVIVQSGGDIEAGANSNNDIAVGGQGRVLIGYFTRVSRPGGSPCSVTLGDAHTMVAAATIQPDGSAAFVPKLMAGGGTVNSFIPRVAVGSDGRAAAAWVGFVGCDSNESATAAPGAAFAPPYTGPGAVADPPELGAIPAAPQFPGPVAFRGDGQLVALVDDNASRAGSFSTTIYDTGVNVEPTPTPTPSPAPAPAPGPGPAPAPGPSPTLPVASAKIAKVKAAKNGTLAVTIKAPAAGRVTAEALVKSKRAAKASKKVAAAKTFTLTLKPKGRFKKQLKKKGRLKATLRISFTPPAGAAPKAVTRKVTFERR